MAAKGLWQMGEIPKIRKDTHTWYSIAAHSTLQDFPLYQESDSLLYGPGMSLDGFDLTRIFAEYNPEQLMQVIGKHGVMLLGEMDVDEWLVRREFEGRSTLTVGREEMHITDWDSMWTEHLWKGKKYEAAYEDNLIRVEAFVVTIRNAAGIRNNGLLYPLIERWENNNSDMDVWGLPTVRALVSYKWNHWAKKYVAIQFVIYLLWVASFMIMVRSFPVSLRSLLGALT